MHEHAEGHSSVWAMIFMVANAAIALSYLAMPILVFRLLPLTRSVKLFAAIFLIGCGITHVGMATWAGGDPGPFWALEHVIQAIGTWGFIITFRGMLRAAQRHRAGRLKNEGESVVPGGDLR